MSRSSSTIRVEPLGVFDGRDQQVRLLGRKGPDLFLQQQVNRHADRGERSLQLVGDRRDRSALFLVQLALLRHVVEDQDHACRRSRRVEDRHGVRAVEPLLVPDELLHDGPRSLELHRTALPQGLLEQVGHPRIRDVRHADFQPQAERVPRRRGRNLHFSLRVEHGDRLGETVERLLGGSLDSQEPGLAVASEFPQGRRHLVERLGELADLVAGSAGKDEVQVSFPDLLGGIRQPGDRPQDPFSREKQETRRDDRGGEQHHVHLPSHRLRLPTGPRIHRHHVLLVHPEDVVRRVLHPLEQREKFVEIRLPPRFTPERGVAHHLDARPELPEKPFQPLRLFPFPGKRYVSQFDLERLLETRLVLRDLVVPLLFRAQEHEHRPAVHPFQGFLHLLAGDHAPVILPEDHVDRLPQGGDPRDVVDPDRGDDDQQSAEPEGQFLTKAQNPSSLPIIFLAFPASSR